MNVLAVPDASTWALWGEDVGRRGTLTVVPADADLLVLPERVPAPLHDAVRRTRAVMPAHSDVVLLATPMQGADARQVLAAGTEGAHDAGHGDEHGHHDGGDDDEHADDGGGHDHHDMMAVTGDPSSDGLIMEDVDVELGPLDPSLPAGLVARLTLDGDVVCACELEAVLGASLLTPEPAAQDALRWAIRLAGRTAPGAAARIRAVELERAAALAGSLQRTGRVLGWTPLTTAAHAVAREVLATRRGAARLGDATAAADDLARLVHGSRLLRFRLAGRATVTEHDVAERDLHGIAARATGVPRDARLDDPAYGALGFEPQLAHAGDAHSRVVLRADELCAALGLAAAAGTADVPDVLAPGVESVFGPLRVETAPTGRQPALTAPGREALRALAGERVAGLEWSTAMAVLASFDLSGWTVAR